MGQKINPNSYRLGISKGWPVRWFLKGGYAKFLEEDEAIRNVINKRIALAGVAGIEIERTQGNLRVFIRAARPGRKQFNDPASKRNTLVFPVSANSCIKSPFTS